MSPFFSEPQFNRCHILMKTTPVRNPFRCAQVLGRAAVAVMLLALFASACLVRAASSPPDRMTYQGFLVDNNGQPLAPSTPINYPVIFRIYDVSEGGAPVWAEQQVVTVDKGSFSVVLGEGTAVTGEPHNPLSSVFLGTTASERYMGLTVTIGANNLTLLPRLRLLPAPYAFLASQAVQLVNPSSGAPFLSLNAGETTIANNARFEGTAFWGSGSGLTAQHGGSIELGNSQTPAATPYMDFHYGTGAFQDFNVRLINDADGRLSLHGGRLSFGNTVANTKISLWDNGGATYGLGIQSGQFRLHLDTPGARFSFLNAPAGSEVMTILGNGSVGIGVTAPSTTLDIYSPSTWRPLAVRGNGGAAYVVAGTLDNRATVGAHAPGPVWSDLVLNGHFGGGVANVLVPGRVGIGTTAPNAPLEVRGFAFNSRTFTHYAHGANIASGFFGSYHIGNIGSGSGNVDYSILAERRIGASEFNAYSDGRIKDVVGVSDGEKDLDLIRQLQVKDYYFVDKIGEGSSLNKGFIAQDVRALMPEAVTTTKKFIPDIYALPKGFAYDAASQRLTITLAKDHEVKAGDRVQVYADESRLELKVESVVSAREFVLEKCERKPGHLFVFGKEVSDFHILNYDRIFSTGISAIQQLHKIVESREARISSLERELAGLKKQVAAGHDANSQWEARFAALEKMVAAAQAVEQGTSLASRPAR
jgi:hypothetical protein